MAVHVLKISVSSFSLDYVDVAWTIAPTPDDLDQYRFIVERSESPEGPFEEVSPPLTDLYQFRDRSVDLYSKWRVFYYRILTRHVPLVGSPIPDEFSKPARSMEEPKVPNDRQELLIGFEIMRRHELALQRQVGRLVLVFKKRTFGQSCPQCYDEIRDRGNDSFCQTCLDSKYRGGYFAPIQIFANFQPSYKLLRITGFHELQPSETVIDMSGYPIMSVNDVVIDKTNKRWRVQDVRNRSHRDFVHRQICRMMEIPKHEVEQHIVVNETMFVIPGDDEIPMYDRVERAEALP